MTINNMRFVQAVFTAAGRTGVHLLEELRDDLLEALDYHRIGWLGTLPAVDLLLRIQLRSIEVDTACTP